MGGGMWAAWWGCRLVPCPLSPAFLGRRRAESCGRCASSIHHRGHHSLTAAGRGLALAASEDKAAKVTEEPDCTSSTRACAPQGGRARWPSSSSWGWEPTT